MSSDDRRARRRSRSPDNRQTSQSPPPSRSRERKRKSIHSPGHDDHSSPLRHHHHHRHHPSHTSRSPDRTTTTTDARNFLLPVPRRGSRGYADALAAGLDESLDKEPYRQHHHQRRRRRNRSRSRERRRQKSSNSKQRQQRRNSGNQSNQQPCSFLLIEGLPVDAEEEQVRDLFAPIPGILQLTLHWESSSSSSSDVSDDEDDEDFHRHQYNRSRHRRCSGSALLEMANIAAAASVMDSAWRDSAYYGQYRLHIDYFHPHSPPPQSGNGNGSGFAEGGNATTNTTTTTDWLCPCCQGINFARRSECYQCHAPRTTDATALGHKHAPSRVLHLGNLEHDVDEEQLEYCLKPLAALRAVRVVRDRLSGVSRGFAFAYFYSVGDATAVMEELNGGRENPNNNNNKWHNLRISFARDTAPGNLVTVGNDDEGDDEDYDKNRAKKKKKKRKNDRDEGGEVLNWEPKAFDAAAVEVTPLEKEEESLQKDDNDDDGGGGVFVYDSATGYQIDSVTGFLFDSATGFYFHPRLQVWGNCKDGVTGEFVPYKDDAETVAALPIHENKKTVVVHAAAVIGAAPQVDPEALKIATEKRSKAAVAGKKEEEAPLQVGSSAVAVKGFVHKGTWAARRGQ